ncbi:MAG: hypothetical protein LAN61_15260 [Acidobacteriia bacterium]|nr:hypothetical protein [Terriglobia bacterium]
MRKHLWKWASLLGVALAVVLLTPQRAAADVDDPPGRIARLSYTKGQISFQPAGTDDWVSAVVNRPITTGDKLWTDRDARAELHMGSAAIRLKGETGFSFLNLTDRIVQIRLTEGVISVRLRQLDPDEMFEVDTPNLAFSLLRPGEYRIEVNETGDATIITVRDGDGEMTGGGQALTVHADQRATFTGTEQLTADVDDAGGYDDFDEWCRDRDRREDRALSTRYVSRDVIGYEDLDEYGEWVTAPDYGYIWMPTTVAVGWAPYRFGHWVWIWPWGWTWVDDAPWGFAPFHYGRWVHWRGRWGWIPCPHVARPVYAPALVAWVGGPRFSLTLTFGRGGGVAWFPLGPREVYIPPYRVSRTYVTNVNVTNTTVNNVYVTNVYNNYTAKKVMDIHYVNRDAPGAVTAVPRNVFASAQPVSRNAVRVNEREIRSAPVSPGAAIAPEQRSVFGAGAEGANVARPPARLQNREVVAKTPPPPRPVPFTAQQKALQTNQGRPLDPEEMRRLRPAAEQQAPRPNVRVAPPAPKPVPVEKVARPRPRRPEQREMPQARPPVKPPVKPPEAPIQPAQPETARPAQPERPAPQEPPPSERIREGRPPAAQRPMAPTPPAQPEAARPAQPEKPVTPAPPPPVRSQERPQQPRPSERVDRPPKPPQQIERETRERQKYEEQQRRLEQKHQQEQEKLQERQQRERQKLDQQAQRQQQKERQKEQQKNKAQEKQKEKQKEKPPASERKDNR